MNSIFSGFNTRPDYENQFVTRINCETAHSRWGGYESEEEARGGEGSGFRFSLDGEWKFCLLPSPDAVPDEFWNKDLGWKSITVPGCWELQGFSAPVYTNSVYPFPDDPGARYQMNPGKSRGFGQDAVLNPPYIPEKNNVGLYVRTFTLPEKFSGRMTYIDFEGVENAFYLYVNGKRVGYSQDSKLPVSFNITDCLRQGENTVALAVFRFSDGFYLEDQDYFHLCGITRRVSLFSKSRVHIEDSFVRAYPIGGGKGEVYVHVKVNREDGFADRHVKLRLYAPDGRLVCEYTQYVDAQSVIHGKNMGGKVTRRPENQTASYLFTVDNPLLWDTDHPNLYRMTFTLLAPDGSEEDFEAVSTGFRRVGIEDGVIKLNGKRVIFRGVDRHEHSYEGGRTVTRERMIEEIKLMKQLNFNAVRTCHYPDSPEWYELCDEYGILVVCEADMESHGVQGAITGNPDWAEAMLERAKRMALTHKNHPCIVSWSLGNESGCNANHAGMAGWLRGFDPMRLVQYEGNDRDETFSDIRCTMYAPIDMLGDMVNDLKDRRPIVLIEYNYQIANAGGGAAEFKALTEKYPLFQGAFAWDWQDKTLPATAGDGTRFPGFGGDFGEDYIDRTVPTYMCCNGMVTCDLKPKPSAIELKQAQSPVDVVLEKADRGVICLRNRSESLSYEELSVEYTLCYKGNEFFRGTAEAIEETDQIRLAARINGNNEWNMLPWPAFPKEGDKYFICDVGAAAGYPSDVTLNVSVKRVTDTAWSKSGFEITLRQFELKPAETFVPARMEGEVIRSGSVFTSDGAEFSFDTENHVVTLGKNGKKYAEHSEPSLFRARTGQVLGDKWGSVPQDAYLAFLPGKLSKKAVSSEIFGSTVRFTDEYTGERGVITLTREFTVLPGGRLKTDCVLSVPAAYKYLPRAGLSFTVEPEFEDLNWYGRGETESYCDRRLAAIFGRYSCRVEDTHFPFIPVSHCGNHCDTHSVSLSDKEGRRLTVEGAPFSFTAHHNTEADYWNVLHEHELVRRREIYLAIDPFEAGIGGDMGWSTEFNPKDMLPAGEYRFGFVLTIE